MKNEISLCMIVKNEEKYLSQCLNSVKDIVDEIIVVDTGSTDKTVDIAKSFGAKLYYFKWNNNFSEARNISLKYATKDWILIMDADDEFCNEDKIKFRELLQQLNENMIYYFETLNYCGDIPNNSNISVNLNPRLFKNNYGFFYEGKVHNQLMNNSHVCSGASCAIRVYHYGYLESTVKDKDKRNRNITLLKDQISKDPNDSYAYFNLGNEYYALGDNEKALECYLKSYEDFSLDKGYSFVLMIKMIIANIDLKRYDEALKLADKAAEYYSMSTDIYYLKGLVYEIQGRYTLAIRALEECIKIANPPSEYKFIYGTESFKSLYELANIYMKLKDYTSAFKYYEDTIRVKRDSVECIYNICHILKEEKRPIKEIKAIIEGLFSEYPKAYQIIADVLFNEGYYEYALEYEKKCEDAGIENEDLKMFKSNCFLRTKNYDECVKMNSITQESPYYFQFLTNKVIAFVLKEQYDEAKKVLENIKGEESKKEVQVYEQFINLFMGKETKILSEDEKEKGYTNTIFKICEILLINKELDKFELSLELLNLISDKDVLNILAKIYYKHGYVEMAKNEVLRSIKIFDVYDNYGLDILREI